MHHCQLEWNMELEKAQTHTKNLAQQKIVTIHGFNYQQVVMCFNVNIQ